MIKFGNARPVWTQNWSGKIGDFDETFDEEREVLLFHGTKMENIASIIKHGLLTEKAHSGLYGKGIYCSESQQKG